MSKPKLEIYIPLIESHANVAYKKIKKPTIYSPEDLVNEGISVFLHILKQYDETKSDIRTYLISSLRNHFFAIIRNSYAKHRGFDNNEERENYAEYQRRIKSDQIEEVSNDSLLSTLNKKERQYITEMFITVSPTKDKQRETVRRVLGMSRQQERLVRRSIRIKINFGK